MEISSISVWIEKDTSIECVPYTFRDINTFTLHLRQKEKTYPAITINFTDVSKIVKFKEAVTIACDKIISGTSEYDKESKTKEISDRRWGAL